MPENYLIDTEFLNFLSYRDNQNLIYIKLSITKFYF